jgi:hypothetical protein
MENDENKAIAEHLQLTLDLADQFLQSTDQDANQALLRAVGTVAQIVFITVPDDRREDAPSPKRLTSCATTSNCSMQ